MPGVIIVYLGLITMFTGGVSVIKPLKFLAIQSRWQALAVVAAGFAIVIIGTSLPAGETRVSAPRTHLDEFMPAWQFNEFHSIRIAAPRDKVYTALKAVTADEITFFRTLIWIRRFGRPGPESILNPSHNTPILEVATKTTFILLAEEPNREIVAGTLVAAPRGWRRSEAPNAAGFKALFDSHQPGFAFAALNFRLEDCEARPRTIASAKSRSDEAEFERASPDEAGSEKASPKKAPLQNVAVVRVGAPGPTEATSPCTTLTTETRVYATDAPTRRAFARYWRVIYPGSSLIRVMWLRAAKKRAEQNSR